MVEAHARVIAGLGGLRDTEIPAYLAGKQVGDLAVSGHGRCPAVGGVSVNGVVAALPQ